MPETVRCLQRAVRIGVLAGTLAVVPGCAFGGLAIHQATELPAFRQVDEMLYRGGQPSQAGLRQLRQMGIKTVISLRRLSKTTREEQQLVEELGMQWVNMPMWFWWRPSREQIRRFLSIVSDPANRPVFVHCRQGWNRAGIMVAIYRVAYQGWDPARAYAEARQYGLVPWNVFSRFLVFREVPRTYAVTR